MWTDKVIAVWSRRGDGVPARTQTFKVHAVLHLEVEAVYGWWTDPARRAEYRAQYEGGDMIDLVWSEAGEPAARKILAEWLTPDGTGYSHRTILRSDPSSRTVEADTHEERVHPDGHRDSSQLHTVIEFHSTRRGHSRLQLVSKVSRSGWNRVEYVDTVARERVTLLSNLRALAQRCEADLTPSAHSGEHKSPSAPSE